MRNKKGFTIVELIVVVTIIMLMSVVGIISFQGANEKARDGRRLADLEKMRIALESYRQVNGRYPEASPNGFPGGLEPEYMPKFPTDPRGYRYVYAAPGAFVYSLSAHMENLGSTNVAEFDNCGEGLACNFTLGNP